MSEKENQFTNTDVQNLRISSQVWNFILPPGKTALNIGFSIDDIHWGQAGNVENFREAVIQTQFMI
jgi:hypothetical protein